MSYHSLEALACQPDSCSTASWQRLQHCLGQECLQRHRTVKTNKQTNKGQERTYMYVREHFSQGWGIGLQTCALTPGPPRGGETKPRCEQGFEKFNPAPPRHWDLGSATAPPPPPPAPSHHTQTKYQLLHPGHVVALHVSHIDHQTWTICLPSTYQLQLPKLAFVA